MKYQDFEDIITSNRLQRYKNACNGNKRRATTLYRRNIKLAEEMFGVINLFEIALRNRIDKIYSEAYGADWLRDAIVDGGRLDNGRCWHTRNIIRYAYNKIEEKNYTKEALLSDCEFGVWRYMFASHPYEAMGNILLNVFPNMPKEIGGKTCNHQFVFEELGKINILRNRIAHHEPICFHTKTNCKESRQVRYVYRQIRTMLRWMEMDDKGLLFGVDHVIKACDKIDKV